MSNNAPQIRFKGYTHAWEKRKLGEVFEQTAEFVNPKENNIELWSLTVENGLTPKTERYNREFLVKKEDSFKVVSPNEFIYNPMNMTLGAVDLNSMGKKVAVSGYYITMQIKNDHSNDYFAVWLRSPKAIRLYKIFATGGLTEKQRVQFPTLSSIETLAPALPEQTTIGQFFATLDSAITLHKQKLDGLRVLKKGYLQQMFPQAGESVPRVRFEGFDGDWVERKLGDLLKVNSGRDYKHLNPGDIPVYGTGGYMLSVDESLSEYDAIGIGRKGTIDKPQLLKAPFWTVDTLFFMLPLPDNDLCFLHAVSQEIEWAKLDESTGVPSLSKTNIESIPRRVPTRAEQIAIGNFFRSLDGQITAQAQKVDQLQTLKKAYLQKMFI